MGKQGPCYHCGVTSTPLWRNGPPEKPVLCNACGSRWRTKGTLANYTPLHARTETDACGDQRVSRIKSISNKREMTLLKPNNDHDNELSGEFAPDYNQGCQIFADEDASNRSSSGSAISNSESCAQYGAMDACDLTGPVQSVVWDAMVPSKKRTCVGRPKASSVEKLTKDLCTILHEQQSYFSASSEEDLLFESETPMVSVEIGHGSILIRHPSYIVRDEESEASSLSVDNKQCPTSEAYSYVGPIMMHNDSSYLKPSSLEVEKIRNYTDQGWQPEQHKSLKVMFNSSQFKENITCFQQLLAEGVFDISLLGAKPEDCKTLKRLAISNLSKSKWVEHYNFLKKCKNKGGKFDSFGSAVTATTNGANKRTRDSRNQNFPELNTEMRSPKRMITKVSCEVKEGVEDGACYSPKSLFALPTDASSLMLGSLNFVEEISEQDLLLEVPSNTSFPQAELLHPSASSSSVYSHLIHH
ncbi:GATA transcription factor 26 isoform X2 [Vigna angularis]|uniref:GATA transcription factor 26 isoform X2 n=1 Tax=Phaseolus angularis TaxID=3914 RepID=UPI0022B2D458|nr:GATA transcription factor 26 isoform X2 [Vigna angularis]